jgi:hypothetical protein
VVALFFSFGGNAFLQSVLYVAIPLAKFRDHERLSLLIGLAVAMLAGYGADSLVRGPIDRQAAARLVRRLIVPLAILLGLAGLFLNSAGGGIPEVRGTFDGLADRTFFTALLLALSIGLVAWRLRSPRQPLWALLAVLLLAADLFSTNWRLNLDTGEPDKTLQANAAVAYIRSDGFGLFRIASEGLLPGDGNAGSLFRLQDTVGNSPLEMDSYQQFGKQVDEWQRWQLLNVRYIITKRNLDKDGRFRLVTRENDVSTYEIRAENRLPRAWVVHNATFAGSDAEAYATVNALNPAAEAVVQDENIWLADQPTPQSDPQPEGAEILEYTPDRVSLTAHLTRPGLLVTSEVYHPDWRAAVDGQPSRILKTDGILRGILVPAGDHVIEMTFRPAGYALGLLLAQQVAQVAVALIGLEVVLRLLMVWLLPLLRWAARLVRPSAA